MLVAQCHFVIMEMQFPYHAGIERTLDPFHGADVFKNGVARPSQRRPHGILVQLGHMQGFGKGVDGHFPVDVEVGLKMVDVATLVEVVATHRRAPAAKIGLLGLVRRVLWMNEHEAFPGFARHIAHAKLTAIEIEISFHIRQADQRPSVL